MNNTRIKEYFEDIALDFDSYYDEPDGFLDQIINSWLRRPGLLKRLKISLDFTDPAPGKRILDVGCGSGKYIVECGKRGAEVTGIDISKEMLKIAKNFCEQNYVKAEFKHGDVTEPLPKGFDVIAALGVFEYFEDPKPILKNMFASTKNGGKILFSVPSSFALQTPLRKLLLYYRNVKCYYHTEKSALSLLDDFKENISKVDISKYGPGMVICINKK